MKINSLVDLGSVRNYLKRIGAEVRSIRTAVVREEVGSYWRDLAVIKFAKDGAIAAPENYLPSEQEQTLITADFAGIEWPTLRVEKSPPLPQEILDWMEREPEAVFEFRNTKGELVMIQVKINARRYIPWTFWDDGQWRKTEPESGLPLWGMEHLGNNTTIIIHEGAKAARSMHRMVYGVRDEDREKMKTHPWGEEMQYAAHLGWIGGAMSPGRTDWSQLKTLGVKRAYIISDNDAAGLSAVPAISFQLKVPTFQIQFTSEWPASFDMADEFPEAMFKMIEKRKHYVGPSFRNCLHPATWATDLIPNPKGKPSAVLRGHFKEMWSYIEEADLFVCNEMPEILRTETVLDKMLAAFSHSQNTCKLIVRTYTGRTAKLCYRPDIEGRAVTDKTTSAINLHTTSTIKSALGDPQPWLDFLEYLVPEKEERTQLMRWCATLIARLGTRMEYGVLMVSEHQGIGKTTLASKILAPLVGLQNVGWPSESAIVQSDFNEWLANKRLVIVNEIYSGHSWKAYNQLKSVITDREVTVNAKYQRPYVVENWSHIFACSNSMRALRMEGDDRRWFYPEVTERAWARGKFAALHDWLNSGGLGIVKAWAISHGNYVLPGERAPMTKRKQDLIDESQSAAQMEVSQLALTIMRNKAPVALATKDIEFWVKQAVQDKVYDSGHDLRKAMVIKGCHVYEERIIVANRMQFVIVSEALRVKLEAIEDPKLQREEIRKAIKMPSEIMQTPM